MGNAADDRVTPPGSRMKVLHLLRDGPEAVAERFIAAHKKAQQVTVIDLAARQTSYEELVDQIFSHDKVICW